MTGSMRKDDTSAEQTIYHFLEKNLYENLKNQYSPNFDFWQEKNAELQKKGIDLIINHLSLFDNFYKR